MFYLFYSFVISLYCYKCLQEYILFVTWTALWDILGWINCYSYLPTHAFLPQGNCTIILFLACLTRSFPKMHQQSWVMWEYSRSYHLLGWCLIASMYSCRCHEAATDPFFLDSIWNLSTACPNSSGISILLSWVKNVFPIVPVNPVTLDISSSSWFNYSA